MWLNVTPGMLKRSARMRACERRKRGRKGQQTFPPVTQRRQRQPWRPVLPYSFLSEESSTRPLSITAGALSPPRASRHVSVRPVCPRAWSYIHFMWSALSGSNASPARSWPHWMRCAYSMQWAALRGVSASVQSGNLVCGGKRSMLQWKHGVTPGMMTREWPWRWGKWGGAGAQAGGTRYQAVR